MIRLIIFLIVLCAQIALGQRLHFTNYPLFEKNAQLGVQHVIQDASGLMWVASGHKLYTFDGLNYSQVTLPDTIQSDISALCNVDRSSEIVWVGTTNGELLNNSSGEFAAVKFLNEKKHRITDVLVDLQGRLWVSTYGSGVFVKESNRQHYEHVPNVSSRDIYCMVLGLDGEVWLGTDNGITSCSYESGKWNIDTYSTNEGLSDEIVKDLNVVNRNLYLGTHEHGLIHFDLAKKRFFNVTPDWSMGEIRRIEPYNNDEMWIVTERQGIYSFNLPTQKFNEVLDQKNVSYRHIKDILIDREGIVWLSSARESLNKAIRYFEFYDPGIRDIQMILDNGTDIYLGTNHGLYQYGLSEKPAEIVKGTENFNLISANRIEDHLLFGTFDKGLVILNSENKQILRITEKDGLPNNSIITIAHKDNVIWLSTLAGICQIHYDLIEDDLRVESISTFDRLTNNYVYDIVFDEVDETIYFATDGHGVAHLSKEKIGYYNLDSITNGQILCLAKGRNNSLWAVDNTAGLCVVDRQRKHLASGVFSTGSEISALISDGNDRMLVCHRNGLDVIDEINGELINYGAESGFIDFNPSLNAVSRSVDGNILVAGHSYVVKIIPPISYGNSPEVHINYIKVGDRVIRPGESAGILGPEEHTIHFNLSGLFFTNPESVGFRYKLDGHDDDWKDTRDQNIIYSKLSPGKYSFQAEAISSKAIYHGGSINRFDFEILPPVWLRWWFISVMILLLLFLIWLFIRYREKMITRDTQLQNAMIERQYEVLKSQLNPHFLFNAFNTLISYIEEEPEMAVEVVEKLSDFYRKILEVKENKLVPIDQELTLLNDYVFLLNKRFGNNLKLKVDLNGYTGWIPPMTLQILVENAVKHNMLSSRHPLYVTLANYDSRYLIVKNNIKAKRQAEQSTGIGLQNIDKRYQLLGELPIKIIKEEKYFSVFIPKIINNKL